MQSAGLNVGLRIYSKKKTIFWLLLAFFILFFVKVNMGFREGESFGLSTSGLFETQCGFFHDRGLCPWVTLSDAVPQIHPAFSLIFNPVPYVFKRKVIFVGS